MTGDLPQLKTKRLWLRKIDQNDSKAIHFLRSNQTVNHYVKRPETQTLQEAIDFIDKINNGISKQDWLFWGISTIGNPELIGTICLWNFSDDRKVAEVGYDLHPEFQRQGIMNEALRCILNYGFETLNLDRIEAYTHRENESSKKLLIKNNFVLILNRKDNENEDNIIFIAEPFDSK